MNKKDAPRFDAEINAIFDLYDKHPPSDVVKRMWWKALRAYPFSAVSRAMEVHVTRGKFVPRPADIIALIEESDGRPGPEEAWAMAMASYDEDETVLLTREIFAARNIARDQFEMVGPIQARMAFLEAYQRGVIKARAENRPVEWCLSAGIDPERRLSVIKRAKDAGLISARQAKHLLPNMSEPEGDAAAIAKLLVGNVIEFPGGKGNAARENALADMKHSLDLRAAADDARREEMRKNEAESKADQLRRLDALVEAKKKSSQ